MVAHDSEGFEAGQSDEVEVVKNFIARRSKANNINDRLHMVWLVRLFALVSPLLRLILWVRYSGTVLK